MSATIMVRTKLDLIGALSPKSGSLPLPEAPESAFPHLKYEADPSEVPPDGIRRAKPERVSLAGEVHTPRSTPPRRPTGEKAAR